MKVLVSTAVLLLATAAQAQTPPSQTPAPQTPSPPPAPTSSLTRDLNSGPPAPATYLAPVPAAEPEAAPATPPPAATVPPAPRPGPSPSPRNAAPTPVLPPSGPVTPPPGGAPPRLTPIPTNPSPAPRMVPITPPAGSAVTAPTPRPSEPFTPPGTARPAGPTVPLEEVVAPPPASPPPPAVTVLDSAARAALPFTADLPAGFEIVTGRPGPDFRIYTIRRAGRSFVMVYTGPASQFPIYSGQMVEAGGRASILSTVDGTRRAVEHLFQRSAAPAEIHVWTMSLDGADYDLAEQIAQSVDVR